MIPAFILALMGGVPGVIRAGLASVATAAVLVTGGHYYNDWIHDPAVRKAALDGYVAKVELDAEKAKAQESERQKRAGDDALEDLAAKLKNSEADAAAANDKLEQEIALHEKQSGIDGRSCTLTGADIEWLRK